MWHAAVIPSTYHGKSYSSVLDYTPSPLPSFQASQLEGDSEICSFSWPHFILLLPSFNLLRDPYKDSLDLLLFFSFLKPLSFFPTTKPISFWYPPGPHQNGTWIFFFKFLEWSLLFPFLCKTYSCSTNRQQKLPYVLSSNVLSFSNPMQDTVLKKMFEKKKEEDVWTLAQLSQDMSYFQFGRAINGKEQLKTPFPSIHLCPRIGSISEFISPWKPHLISSFAMFSPWIISLVMWLV